MSDITEAVARAICAEVEQDPDEVIYTVALGREHPMWEAYVSTARAANAAYESADWAAEFAPKGACCLCGNHGVIDTRGKVFTPAGSEVGARVYCICPNGRRLKSSVKRP